MDIFESRTSVRAFTDEPVAKSQVMALLRAAMLAPSACNQQPWRFYVIYDKKLQQALCDTSPYAAFGAKAPVLIVITYVTDCIVSEFAPIDASCAAENLWLKTAERGLGGTWMGVSPRRERALAVKKLLGLPVKEEAFALFALGHPQKTRSAEDRWHPDWIHERR